MIEKVLIVDDEELVRDFLEENMSRQGIETVFATNAEEAVNILKTDDIQLAFVDLMLGKTSGMDVLKYGKDNAEQTVFVMITAYGTLETAVEAMKLGAFDFLIKPFSPDQAAVVVEKAKRWYWMNKENHFLKQEIRKPEAKNGNGRAIVGRSEAVKQVLQTASRVAPTDSTILITGESGTGKELIAKEITRQRDPKEQQPFIKMNCAAVPENLLESELFGHEKGAFTGAAERRIGRFELADGGTLLLDEIGEISLAMQAKLLRVLQESEFERVGGTKTLKVNVRVIATTNRNLKEETEKGNFREDLYYRLNVFPLHLPPLRERENDVIEIAESLLNKQSEKIGKALEFSDDAKKCIWQYDWPGNIRELENVIERMAILCDGPVMTSDDLPEDVVNPPVSVKHQETDQTDLLDLKEIEKQTISKALSKTQGNRTRAAELLGFSVRTLRNKLKEHNELGEADASVAETAV